MGSCRLQSIGGVPAYRFGPPRLQMRCPAAEPATCSGSPSAEADALGDTPEGFASGDRCQAAGSLQMQLGGPRDCGSPPGGSVPVGAAASAAADPGAAGGSMRAVLDRLRSRPASPAELASAPPACSPDAVDPSSCKAAGQMLRQSMFAAAEHTKRLHLRAPRSLGQPSTSTCSPAAAADVPLQETQHWAAGSSPAYHRRQQMQQVTAAESTSPWAAGSPQVLAPTQQEASEGPAWGCTLPTEWQAAADACLSLTADSDNQDVPDTPGKASQHRRMLDLPRRVHNLSGKKAGQLVRQPARVSTTPRGCTMPCAGGWC